MSVNCLFNTSRSLVCALTTSLINCISELDAVYIALPDTDYKAYMWHIVVVRAIVVLVYQISGLLFPLCRLSALHHHAPPKTNSANVETRRLQ